jgi:hypothetical protein
MSEMENKIRGIIGLYSFYKHQLNTVQRVALLTTWVEVCVNKEEYEVANALQQQLDRITSGEEEYHLIAPAEQNNLLGPAGFIAPTMNEIKNRIAISINEKPKKKKLTWVNNWGTGSFTVFKLKFGDFRFILFNLGVEMR